jgi:hypothetical protein
MNWTEVLSRCKGRAINEKMNIRTGIYGGERIASLEGSGSQIMILIQF